MKCTPRLLYLVATVLVFIFAIYSFYGYHKNYSYSIDSPSARMRAIYIQQSDSRRNVMRNILKKEERSPALFYNVIVPEVLCTELVRIGTVGDGGKWMCSPEEMPTDCIVLSLGLNNVVSWDEEIQKLTQKRCRLIGYDAAEQSSGTRKRLSELNAVANVGFIGKMDVANKSISLESVMKENNIKQIEIFKVDIEGSEFEVLVPFLTNHTVSQILIEIHAREPVMKPAAYKFVDLLSQLNRLGYLIANYEINGAWQELSEFTLIHNSALQRYNAYLLAEYMDILEHE